MASTLRRWIQLARADFDQYRRRILLYTFPTRQDERVYLPAFFWFTYRETLWKKDLRGGPPYISTKDLTSYIDHWGNKDVAEICNFVIAATTSTREDEEIHQYWARVEMKVEKGNWWFVSVAPEVDDHLEVCQFLSQSDEQSVKKFAHNFLEANFHHWDEKLRVWALAEIYYKAFPKKFLAWIVGMAIRNKNEIFLAYLLVRTHREGEDSVRNLQDEYTALWGITLEFEVPDWEKEFYDAVLSFWEGPFQRINNS